MSADEEFRRGVQLGRGAEFDLIRRILEPGTASLPPELRVGPGDDAAVLDPESGEIVVSCDLSVEGVHFRREWITLQETGYRAAAAALSDLAAMAARPMGALLARALPRARAEEEGPALAEGVRAALDGAETPLLGGDLSRSPGPLVLDVVVVGWAERAMLRSGARPGDELWVTGGLGAAAGAVRLWMEGREVPPELRGAFVHPAPRIREARWLVERAGVHALVDLSDGLAGDAGHLAAAGGVRIVLEGEAVPVAAGVAEAVGGEERALELALHGGEDYELCFAAAPGSVEGCREAFREAFGLSLTRVGWLEEGAGVWLLPADGRGAVLLNAGAFSHFGEGGSG